MITFREWLNEHTVDFNRVSKLYNKHATGFELEKLKSAATIKSKLKNKYEEIHEELEDESKETGRDIVVALVATDETGKYWLMIKQPWRKTTFQTEAEEHVLYKHNGEDVKSNSRGHGVPIILYSAVSKIEKAENVKFKTLQIFYGLKNN